MESAAPAPIKAEMIRIKVKTQEGDEVEFKMRKTSAFARMMGAFAERIGQNPEAIRFLFDGARIHKTQTPEELSMEDGDVVDAMLEQIGGSPSAATSQFVLALGPELDVAARSADFLASLALNKGGDPIDPSWVTHGTMMWTDVTVNMPSWFIEAVLAMPPGPQKEAREFMEAWFRRATEAACAVCTPDTDPLLVRRIIQRQSQSIFDLVVLPEVVAMFVVDCA